MRQAQGRTVTTMTEAALREKVVNQLRSWIGRNEADGSHKAIIDIYNTITPLPVGYRLQYTDPWCAGTVSAAAQACVLTDIIFPECSCSRMIALYQAAGRWMEDDAYIPQPGDLAMYGWKDSGIGDYTGMPDHVGMVESCDGKTMTIIEGNKNNAVERRTIPVDARYIRGFCLPNYGSKATQAGFPDVAVGAYYEEAVAWAAANGIVAGYPDGNFHPDDPITRAQAVTMLYRFSQRPDLD